MASNISFSFAVMEVFSSASRHCSMCRIAFSPGAADCIDTSAHGCREKIACVRVAISVIAFFQFRGTRGRSASLSSASEFNTALAAFNQHDHCVEAQLSTGETTRIAYLVGCDGGHSTVRKSLGIQLEGESIDEQPMFVADVEIDTLARHDWHIWPLAPGGAIGLCPLPQTSLFQLTGKASALEADPETVVHRATGHRVARLGWHSVYRPAVRMVNRYRVGRVFLAGDAAHVHPPAGGQGLNTGVQDAYNLGWKLAHVLNGGPDSLLDTYQSERLPIAAAVLGLSKHLHQKQSMKRGALTDQLGLHYRDSSLSSGQSLGALRPGDRMPNLPLANGASLFDHMRGPRATSLATIEGPRILIRPDGYIAHSSQQRQLCPVHRSLIAMSGSSGKAPTEGRSRHDRWLPSGVRELCPVHRSRIAMSGSSSGI